LTVSKPKENEKKTENDVIYLSVFTCSITYHTAQHRERNSGTGRTRLTALTAALRNGKMKKKNENNSR